MKKVARTISALTALAFSGLTLLTPINPVSATITPNVPVSEQFQGYQFELPEEKAPQRGRNYVANRVGAGTSDLCDYLTRQCTLRHGYGNGIFWSCMRRGGCG